MKKRMNVNLLTEMAVFAALGFVLDVFQGAYSGLMPFWPNGGSVGIAMCAIFMFSFRYGLWGLLCGGVVGILSMLGGVYISGFADNGFKILLQVFLDYIGAWMAVGLAGIFANMIKKSHKQGYIIIGILIASTGRFICHFLSGLLFWPSTDSRGKIIYSLTYNMSYILPSAIICMVLMCIIIKKHPEFIDVKLELKEEEE